MNEKWVDDIRDRMNEFQQAPPEGLLESARHEIKARKIRKRKWLFVGVAAAILAGIFPVAYIIIGIESVDSSSFMASQTMKHVDISVNERGQNPRIDNTASDNEQNNRRQRASFVYTNEKQGVSRVIPGKESEFMDPEKDAVQIEVAESNTIEDLDSPIIINSERDDADLPLANVDHVEMNNHPCSTIGMSASINGLGGLFAANSDAKQNHYAHADARPMTRMGGGVLEESSSSNVLPAPSFIEIFDHKIPLRFSLDYSWQIAHNFEIGTGLTYSYLRSDIRCGYASDPLHNFEQRLHFLGIPIAFRFIPLRIRKIGLYISAGMMAEKCLGGKIVGKSADYPDYTYVGSEERPFQFSVNIAGGIRYDFNRNYGIYLEPGAGFYLKNGSGLRTIYAECPVTFNINIGFRFNH